MPKGKRWDPAPDKCPRCNQPRPVVKKCSAKSKQTGNQCRNYATPGKNVCKFHGGYAGRKPSTYVYAKVMDKCPELKKNYEHVMAQVEELGGQVDLTVAGEINLIRARIMTAIETVGRDDDKPSVDFRLIQDMLRDLMKAVQKEREIEISLQNLVPMAKVKQLLQLAIQCVTRFVPTSSQEECFDELSRILEPFQSSGEDLAPAIAALPPTPDDETE